MQPQGISEPKHDPPSQGPASFTSTAPTPVLVTIKEEPEQTQHLPPIGSVDNPMEIDDSDDEPVFRGSASTPKRRMKSAWIADDLPTFLKFPILVPPPDGETPEKRAKPASNRPSGSKDPAPAATSKTSSVSDNVAGSSKQPV